MGERQRDDENQQTYLPRHLVPLNVTASQAMMSPSKLMPQQLFFHEPKNERRVFEKKRKDLSPGWVPNFQIVLQDKYGPFCMKHSYKERRPKCQGGVKIHRKKSSG